MTIVEFLEARLAEEEEIAWATEGAPSAERIPLMVHVAAPTTTVEIIRSGIQEYAESIEHEDNSMHTVRHERACILREVATKRAIIEEAHAVLRWNDPDLTDAVRLAASILEILASAYSGYPEYRAEWKTA